MAYNGMNFGMDGPNVTGWWVNPKTGDKFNAVDTFFEGNNLLIKTADGRLLNYNQIQNYIHTNNPDSVQADKPSPSKSVDDSIPAEILAELEDPTNPVDNGLLIPDDNIYGLMPVKQAPSAELGNMYKDEPKPVINDFDIIDRALGKAALPTVEVVLCWKSFPEREIEMLIDVMGINENDIVEYYINKISLSDIKESVTQSIRSFIYSKFHEKVDIANEDPDFTYSAPKNECVEVVEKPKQPKKKTATKKK